MLYEDLMVMCFGPTSEGSYIECVDIIQFGGEFSPEWGGAHEARYPCLSQLACDEYLEDFETDEHCIEEDMQLVDACGG
jgi:hypothetical protein